MMFGRHLTQMVLKPNSQKCRTFSVLHSHARDRNSFFDLGGLGNSSLLGLCRSCTGTNENTKKISFSRTIPVFSATCVSSHKFSTSAKDNASFKDIIQKIYDQRNNVKTGRDSLLQKYTAAHFVDAAPKSWKPYLQLARVDKPIGSWLLYLPCALSITLATPLGSIPDLYYLGLFGVGAFLMRGAGCVINDLWDKDFDKYVERTKERPLASGKLKPRNAIALLAAQLSLSLGILLTLNTTCIMIGVASMIPVILYPLAKRYTYYPQAVLGLTFNMGAIMGYAAVVGSINWSIVGPLYLGCFFWTMYYDTIYALQDVEDDVLIGVKSIAMVFTDVDSEKMKKLPLSDRIEKMEGQKKKIDLYLSGFFLATMTSWMWSFNAVAVASFAYFVPVLQMIKMINDQAAMGKIESPKYTENLWEKFVASKKTGLYILFGLIGGIYFSPPREVVK
ncbi:4-hydroxybenzoate polyprenyltransferase, mitochondrial-like [Styela clava]